MDADLSVGGLPGILIAEPAAVTDDPLADIVDAQSPAGEVHLMDALIAEVAVAVIPLPVPVVMELRAGQGVHRRRPAPDVVVDVFRNGVGSARSDRRAALVAQAAGQLHFADSAGMDEIHQFARADARAAL